MGGCVQQGEPRDRNGFGKSLSEHADRCLESWTGFATHDAAHRFHRRERGEAVAVTRGSD